MPIRDGRGMRRLCLGIILYFCTLSSVVTAETLSVTALPVAQIAIADSQAAPAEVVPANRTALAAEVTARIEQIAADVGASVKKGDLLVRLDDTDYRLALRQVEKNIASIEAEIEQAKIQLQRTESLADRQFASDDDVLERTTALTVLKSRVQVERATADIARANLKRTRVYAPFDGEIEERYAQQGAYATAGGLLMTVTQTSDREIAAQLHPPFVASLVASDNARFVSDGRDYAVTISRVAQVINPDTRLQTVRLTFAADEAPVGTTGSLKWQREGGLLPAHLVVQRQGRLGVFVALQGRARFHALEGAAEGRAVVHGLEASALVVVEGRTRLQDGDEVTLVQP